MRTTPKPDDYYKELSMAIKLNRQRIKDSITVAVEKEIVLADEKMRQGIKLTDIVKDIQKKYGGYKGEKISRQIATYILNEA